VLLKESFFLSERKWRVFNGNFLSQKLTVSNSSRGMGGTDKRRPEENRLENYTENQQGIITLNVLTYSIHGAQSFLRS
jgi:hypothetical protein